MKELFSFISFKKDEREILDSVSLLLDKAVADQYCYSPRQLHYMMIRNNVINGKDVPFTAFAKMLRRGLYGGVLDWHGMAHKRVYVNPDSQYYSPGIVPAELYVRGAYISDWVEQSYSDTAMGINTTSGLAWDPCAIYWTAVRAHFIMQNDKEFLVDYLSDSFDTADHMYKKFCKVLRKMVQVKLARDYFNHCKHGITWEAAGVSHSGKSYMTFRRYATAALQVAKGKVDALLKITNLGLKRGSKLAKDTHQGRLASLPLTTLTALLYNAPHRSVI